MELAAQTMRAQVRARRPRRIAFGIDAHGEDADACAPAIEAPRNRVELCGDDRAHVGASGVEKCQEYEAPALAGQPDGPPLLVVKPEVRCRDVPRDARTTESV